MPKRRLIQPIKISLGNKEKLLPKREPRIIPSKELGRIIQVCRPTLEGNELKYLIQCVKKNWISSLGRYIPKFEEKFAHAVGAKYGVACTSGTCALHLALYILDIGPGDEVIIPTFTMIATANAVRYTGAKPVLVDSELKTWNIDTDKIEEKINKRTKAIVAVHTYGHPCNMDKILKIAKRYNLWVVEDAAEAHGAAYKKRKVGSIGDVACFSFYANKIITTGEGGMITTDNKDIYVKACNIRDHAFSKDRHFWHPYLGFNYRMTNLQGAIGLAQVERFKTLISRRIKNAMLYNSLLKGIKGLVLPPKSKGIKNVYWMYSILVNDDFGGSKDDLRKKLATMGIETRSFFIPVHLQPIYFKEYRSERFPNAELLCRSGLYLPSATNLTEKEIRYIAGSIGRIAKTATTAPKAKAKKEREAHYES